jgi:molybdopterin-containing oxidoreductase family iron-sulfur binding subunit
MTDRRRFLLASGAALAGIALAPGVVLLARPPEQAVSGKVRWGMLVDTRRCRDGCKACVGACNRENALGNPARPTDAQWIRKVTLENPRGGAGRSLPVMCQHCAHPPCVDVCPTGASFRRADGIVLVDRHTCIGCRYCMMACPYKARSFVHEPIADQNPEVPRGKGCVESCTLCVHRVDRGRIPACVEACAAEGGALVFGDLNDPASELSKRLAEFPSMQIRADLGLDAGVRYQGI